MSKRLRCIKYSLFLPFNFGLFCFLFTVYLPVILLCWSFKVCVLALLAGLEAVHSNTRQERKGDVLGLVMCMVMRI